MNGTVHVAIIAAVAENGVIGDGDAIPWRLSTDMRRFKRLTMGKPVVMGRRTFDTIGKPLPGRPNIVVSRRADFRPEDVIVVPSPFAAIEKAAVLADASGVDEVMVIGGAEIYAATMARADRLYLTHVASAPEGDAFFPRFDPAEWIAVEEERVPAGDRDEVATRFVAYRRRDGRRTS